MASFEGKVYIFSDIPPVTISVTAPSFTCSAVGEVKNTGSLYNDLPTLTIYSGSDGIKADLPSIQIGTGFYSDPSKTVLPSLTCSGISKRELNDVIVDLPSFTISTSHIGGAVGNASLDLPSIQILIKEPVSGVVDAELPLPEIYIFIDTNYNSYLTIDLLDITVSAESTTGDAIYGWIYLDYLDIESYTGAVCNIDLEGIFGVEGVCYASPPAHGRIGFLSIDIHGLVLVGGVINADLEICDFSVDSSGYVGTDLYGQITIYNFILNSNISNFVSRGVIDLLWLGVDATGLIIPTLSGNLQLDIFDVYSGFRNIIAHAISAGKAISINKELIAPSEYTNFNYIDIVSDNKYFFVTDGTNIYRLDSDIVDFVAEAGFGNLDIDLGRISNYLRAYITGKLSNVEAELNTENGEYHYRGYPIRTNNEYRVVVGKGIRGRMKELIIKTYDEAHIDRIRLIGEWTGRRR